MPIPPLPAGGFAFGVFGDGPYYPDETERFKRVLDDVRSSDIEWLIHIGDLLWCPCSDDALAERLAELNAADCPVVYTPGDNEWTDTHDEGVGGYDPLDRLASIRRIFFCNPGMSVGGRCIKLTCQGQDRDFPEFTENSCWTHRGFVFATMHLVGSNNGRAPFAARTAAHDAEVERRTDAALAWLEKNVRDFAGSVLLIHGDTHTQRVDHPLADSTGRPYENFTRLEAFGSPQIGWVRVVVDPNGGNLEYDPRLME